VRAPFSNFESRASILHNSADAKNIERLLIVRLSAMGDVIHTLPAVSILRSAFPRAHIGWLIEERWAELLCAPGYPRRGVRTTQRPLVDEVHSIDLKAWRRSLFSVPVVRKAATLWNDVRAMHYDAVIDLQGAMRSAVLARLSGARVVYGAAEPRESPASLWYSRKIVARGRHVVEQNISLVQNVIGHYCNEPSRLTASVQLPQDFEADACISKQLAEKGIRQFAILNPGAGWGAKRWPTERYGEVARALSEIGIAPLVNYGPGEDDLFESVSAASGGTAKPAQNPITELIALMRRARLFIGGDTGPLHLAAALRIPVVAIFGPTDPARNGPYGTHSIVLRSPESLTSYARNTSPEEGLLGIGADDIIAAARKLLSNA
jgi:heptosyltransferase I